MIEKSQREMTESLRAFAMAAFKSREIDFGPAISPHATLRVERARCSGPPSIRPADTFPQSRMTQGYTLMFSVVHGNVLGTVIAPKGQEDLPKGKRALVWRVIVRPLVDEVAEHEEFPVDDARKVVAELGKFCMEEGVTFSIR